MQKNYHETGQGKERWFGFSDKKGKRTLKIQLMDEKNKGNVRISRKSREKIIKIVQYT